MKNIKALFGIVDTTVYTVAGEKRLAEVRKQPNGKFAFEIFTLDGPDTYRDASLYQSVKDLTKREALRLLEERR